MLGYEWDYGGCGDMIQRIDEDDDRIPPESRSTRSGGGGGTARWGVPLDLPLFVPKVESDTGKGLNDENQNKIKHGAKRQSLDGLTFHMNDSR